MKLFKKVKTTNKLLLERIGNRVYFGPFSGLKIPKKVAEILTVSEVLGLYESCLHSKLSLLLNKTIKNIVLVGGNNGYYAAGLNYIFQPDMIQIYETEKFFHDKIESWFVENNLYNYEIFAEANQEVFENLLLNVDLLFMDCEGCELQLLDPILFPWQKKADILFELHPFYIDNLIAIISDKFRKTHLIEIIYDDFDEDIKIEKIIAGIDLKIEYAKHPNHRWIIENGNKIFTSGVFMLLTQK